MRNLRKVLIILGAILLVTVAREGRVLFQSPSRSGRPKNALSAETKRILESGEHFTLFSLDPRISFMRLESEPSPKEEFHGFAVLGKTEIRDLEQRTELVEALCKGIAKSDGRVAACFNPRHGIRATLGRETVDLVICFQCSSIETYMKNERVGNFPTTSYAQPFFERAVEKAELAICKDK